MPLPPGFVEDVLQSSTGSGQPPAGFTEDPTSLASAIGPGQEANARNFALASGDPRAIQGAQSDPILNAKAMPTVLGTAGAFTPIPGGATMGTAAGQGIRDAMLKTMGQPLPSSLQHVGELGLSALGDATAIPAIKGNIAGKQIGEAMGNAGLNAVEKTAPPSNIRTAIKLAQQINAKGALTPEEATSLKPAIDSIWSKGWLSQKAYSQYAPDVAQASSKIADALNTVPGRAGPSADMASAMTIPNAIKGAWQATRRLPLWVQIGLGTSGGGGLLGALTGLGGKR